MPTSLRHDIMDIARHAVVIDVNDVVSELNIGSIHCARNQKLPTRKHESKKFILNYILHELRHVI